MIFNLDEKTLLQQVKDNGFTGAGKIYGVSDNAIRKRLRLLFKLKTNNELKQLINNKEVRS